MISTIIVLYNSLVILPRCIDALAQCSVARDLELILVDNGSTDGTCTWIEDHKDWLKGIFGKVQYIPLESNRGFAYANNRGAERAEGDVALLLNPDVIVQPDTIERCAGVLKSDPSIGAVGCRLHLEDGRLDRACRRSLPTLWNSFARLSGLSLLFPNSRLLAGYNLTYLPERQDYDVGCICGAFLMIRISLYKELRGLDEDFFMYGEDVDLCRRVVELGVRIRYVGTESAMHLKGGSGGKRSAKSLWDFYEAMLTYYLKHNASQRWLCVTAPILHLALRMMFAIHLVARTVRSLIGLWSGLRIG